MKIVDNETDQTCQHSKGEFPKEIIKENKIHIKPTYHIWHMFASSKPCHPLIQEIFFPESTRSPTRKPPKTHWIPSEIEAG